MDERKKVRPIYSELQGYLSQCPEIGEHGNAVTRDDSLWRQYNSTIDELNTLTGNDFNKFKVTGLKHTQLGTHLLVTELRTKLGSLVARLHGTYFSDEPAPFSGMPSTTITLSNQQHQLQQQSALIEFRTTLEKKAATMPESKERSFLTELKDGIGTIKDFSSLMLLIAELAGKYGISIAALAKLFS